MKIQIILGSTRPNRKGESVAKWVYETANNKGDAEFELVDVADFDLPLLDEPKSPMMGDYVKDHTKIWSEKISQADGYIFVTAEYNHAVPGAFKNAVDFLHHEWTNKAIGFVGYGTIGAARAVENWRLVAAELQMADIREQLMLNIFSEDFDDEELKPTEKHEEKLGKVLNQLVLWAEAMKAVREKISKQP